jgi:hypothetical protein
MHQFDLWLLERLVAVGALRLGEQAPDVATAISLYQDSKGIAITGEPDVLTVYELRRDQGARPDVAHVVFNPIPSSEGSIYIKGSNT